MTHLVPLVDPVFTEVSNFDLQNGAGVPPVVTHILLIHHLFKGKQIRGKWRDSSLWSCEHMNTFILYNFIISGNEQFCFTGESIKSRLEVKKSNVFLEEHETKLLEINLITGILVKEN